MYIQYIYRFGIRSLSVGNLSADQVVGLYFLSISDAVGLSVSGTQIQMAGWTAQVKPYLALIFECVSST